MSDRRRSSCPTALDGPEAAARRRPGDPLTAIVALIHQAKKARSSPLIAYVEA